ncbi:MAG: alpha/beta hydrolase [Lachnospiraceae bacterium]|nr:alpha/beta hydrolase [Lachnospiraceae bacterium]
MKYIEEKVSVKGSADYARVSWYIIDHSEEIGIDIRPLVIVCPGGGYCFTSDREAEMFALQWTACGYHACVLRYSVSPEAEYPVALNELAALVLEARDKADEWRIDTDLILLQGSSAAGHLVCHYGQMWNKPFLKELSGAEAEDLKVAGLILNYPVITSGEYAHEDSFRKLLGDRYDEMKDSLSLEKNVDPSMPPAFIWTTNEDGLVPAENSIMLALAMRKAGVSAELHMYAKGDHGLGLADIRTITADGGNLVPSVTTWMNLARIWIETVILSRE